MHKIFVVERRLVIHTRHRIFLNLYNLFTGLNRINLTGYNRPTVQEFALKCARFSKLEVHKEAEMFIHIPMINKGQIELSQLVEIHIYWNRLVAGHVTLSGLASFISTIDVKRTGSVSTFNDAFVHMFIPVTRSSVANFEGEIEFQQISFSNRSLQGIVSFEKQLQLYKNIFVNRELIGYLKLRGLLQLHEKFTGLQTFNRARFNLEQTNENVRFAVRWLTTGFDKKVEMHVYIHQVRLGASILSADIHLGTLISTSVDALAMFDMLAEMVLLSSFERIGMVEVDNEVDALILENRSFDGVTEIFSEIIGFRVWYISVDRFGLAQFEGSGGIRKEILTTRFGMSHVRQRSQVNLATVFTGLQSFNLSRFNLYRTNEIALKAVRYRRICFQKEVIGHLYIHVQWLGVSDFESDTNLIALMFKSRHGSITIETDTTLEVNLSRSRRGNLTFKCEADVQVKLPVTRKATLQIRSQVSSASITWHKRAGRTDFKTWLTLSPDASFLRFNLTRFNRMSGIPPIYTVRSLKVSMNQRSDLKILIPNPFGWATEFDASAKIHRAILESRELEVSILQQSILTGLWNATRQGITELSTLDNIGKHIHETRNLTSEFNVEIIGNIYKWVSRYLQSNFEYDIILGKQMFESRDLLEMFDGEHKLHRAMIVSRSWEFEFNQDAMIGKHIVEQRNLLVEFDNYVTGSEKTVFFREIFGITEFGMWTDVWSKREAERRLKTEFDGYIDVALSIFVSRRGVISIRRDYYAGKYIYVQRKLFATFDYYIDTSVKTVFFCRFKGRILFNQETDLKILISQQRELEVVVEQESDLHALWNASRYFEFKIDTDTWIGKYMHESRDLLTEFNQESNIRKLIFRSLYAEIGFEVERSLIGKFIHQSRYFEFAIENWLDMHVLIPVRRFDQIEVDFGGWLGKYMHEPRELTTIFNQESDLQTLINTTRRLNTAFGNETIVGKFLPMTRQPRFYILMESMMYIVIPVRRFDTIEVNFDCWIGKYMHEPRNLQDNFEGEFKMGSLFHTRRNLLTEFDKYAYLSKYMYVQRFKFTTFRHLGLVGLMDFVIQHIDVVIPPNGEIRIDSGYYTVIDGTGKNIIHTARFDWIFFNRWASTLQITPGNNTTLEGEVIYNERFI